MIHLSDGERHTLAVHLAAVVNQQMRLHTDDLIARAGAPLCPCCVAAIFTLAQGSIDDQSCPPSHR